MGGVNRPRSMEVSDRGNVRTELGRGFCLRLLFASPRSTALVLLPPRLRPSVSILRTVTLTESPVAIPVKWRATSTPVKHDLHSAVFRAQRPPQLTEGEPGSVA